MSITAVRASLLVLVFVVDAGQPWVAANARGAASLQVSADLLSPGQPRLIQGLPAFATRCFPTSVPSSVQKVRVVASVVSLAGFPVLCAGWEPTRPQANSSETGYETLDEVFDNALDKDTIFVCVRTFSSQGCDSVLTVFATPHLHFDKEYIPFAHLELNYPSIWQLRDSAAPARMGFTTQADFLEDLRLVAFPLSGHFEVEVYRVDSSSSLNASSCIGHGIKVERSNSELVLVDLLQVHGDLNRLEQKFCIMIVGSGTVYISVARLYPGPFLAPAVPHAGLLSGAACDGARILVKDGVDVTVTAVAADASELTLSAMLTTDTLQASILNRWRGKAPPGGSGAALLISSKDVMAAGDSRSEESIYVRICRNSNISTAEATEFWITAETDTGVMTLKDGVAIHSSVPPAAFSAGSWKETWREFRVLIPDGPLQPTEVTLSASSIGKVHLVADTHRHPDPASYSWATAGATSNEVLRFTTQSQLAGHGVGLIACRLPCFLYLAATATAHNAEVHVPLSVRAVLDSQGTKQLLEGDDFEQVLPSNRSQVFAYSVRRSRTAVLVSVSKLSGSTSFVMSSSPDFPDGWTTGPAEAVILLEPGANVFRRAAEAVAGRGVPPVLYIRVQNAGMQSSRFIISARSQAHAKWLLNGATTQGAVKALRYDRFRFFVSDGEVRHSMEITIEVILHSGSVALFAACDPNRYPQESHYDWSRPKLSGPQGSLVIAASSKSFRAGWIFLAVTSDSLAAYSLRIRWGDDAVKLKDGIPERGHLSPGFLRWFALNEFRNDDQPVAVRAEAVAGSFGLCVRSKRTRRRLEVLGQAWGLLQRLRNRSPRGWKENLGCSYAAVANASRGVGASLAAIDIPSENTGASLEVGLLGLSPGSWSANTSEFVLHVILDDVVTLPEEQTVVVDSLAPPCCSSGPKLHRMYRHYTRFSSGSLRIFLTPLGAGQLTGAKLSARRKGEPVWFQSQEVMQERVLQLYINLQDMSGQHAGGFWLEVAVEVHRPTNYTLSLLSDSAEDLPTRLAPNVPVFDNLSEVASGKYSFHVAAQVATLCLKPCYGQVRMRITSDSVQSPKDSSAHGMCTQLNSGGDSLSGSVVVDKLLHMPSPTYEIELTTHPGNDYIQLPRMTDLKAKRKHCEADERCSLDATFSFDAASVGVTAGMQPGSARLRHTLIALKVDPDVHPETTCGLLAALATNRTISTLVVKDSARHSQLEGNLRFDQESNSSIMVNVLVTLEDLAGAHLAAASYMPFELVAAVERSPEPDNIASSWVGCFVLVLCGGGCLLNKTRRASKGHQDVREADFDRIEIQMAYELHEEGAASLLAQQSYVPPNV